MKSFKPDFSFDFKIKLVRIIGLFGIDLFQISERIVNQRSLSFFNGFISKSNECGFILEQDLIRGLFRTRFKQKDVHDNLIEVLTDLYISRIIDERLILEKPEMKFIENLVMDNENLYFEDLFLISKLLSRLGLFSVANNIEQKTYSRLKLINTNSTIYDIFQSIKIELFSNPLGVELYLNNLKLIRHMNKFYDFELFLRLFTASLTKPSNLILGPLRDSLNSEDLRNYNCIILKPNRVELEKISSISFKKKLYLYSSYKSISPEFLNSENIINVVEYYDKVNSSTKLKMSFNHNFYLINGFPQHLQRSIMHQIMGLKQKKFIIDHFSFYLSNNLSAINYEFPYINVDKMTQRESNHLIWENGWHDLLSNFRFSKFLYNNNIIESRSVSINNILNMSVEEYALNLEKLYSK